MAVITAQTQSTSTEEGNLETYQSVTRQQRYTLITIISDKVEKLKQFSDAL